MHRSACRRALRDLIPLGSSLALGLCFPSLSWAQTPAEGAPAELPSANALPPLTLQQALALAMSSNAELAVLRREVEALEGPVIQGAARPNPELSFLLEDTRRSSRTTTLQINQPLELGNKRAARIGVAERGRDMAAAELAAKRADLRATVASTFYEVLLAQERLALSRGSVDVARRASDAAGKRVQAGKISPVEETKARIAEATARLESAQAEAELKLSRLRLAATWAGTQADYGPAAPVTVSFDPPVVPTPDTIARRLDASPRLTLARFELQRRQAMTELARAQRTPDLTVSLGVKRDEELGRNQAVIGLSIPLPVFDRNEGNLLEALKREEKSRDEWAAADIQLRTSVLQSTSRLEAAGAEVRMLRDQVLPGAQSAYDAATKGFELGKFNVLDVLDAQRTLFQAQANHLRARGDALRAAVEVDRLLGDGESTAVPPGTPPKE
ncbi:MAG: TolC family protein [Burkholderiaceae bacterium]|nr:TolC family protein [Burkholderiaceae bacterium]